MGLGRLHDALQNHGERLLEILALTEEIHENVLDLKTEQAKLGEGFQEIYAVVFSLGEKLDRLHERNLRPTDVTSIRGGTERQLVKAVKERFRALSEPKRQEAPALLNAIGKLEMAAGDYEEAHQDFRQVASIVNDRAAKASAHHGAFLAAMEKKDWTTALNELLEASRLDPERFALFPLDRYEPERILGAGGFGIVFLCRNRLSKARMVVKSLRTDELDRDLSAVLEEAGALEQLHHEAIIRLRDCGCADANQTRPYLVMDFFDGVTLDDFIKQHGPLPAQDAKGLARQVAEGLSAAHAKDILHRDVKPGNVLLERGESGLRIKLIDFGLAMRQRAVHSTITNASALSNTIRGQSIAGTLDYASPEQMGKLPGEAVSRRSDVYGFGRTLCFALFGTPNPTFSHWLKLPDEQFRELINECINESPKNRPDGFPPILDRLGWISSHQARSVPSSPAVTEPLVLNVTAAPAPQVAVSHLPPLAQDILALEGRLNGLRQTIAVVEHGQHPDLRAGWKALEGHTTSRGQSIIEALKQRIEKTPSCRDSELCALAPDAPQAALLVVINSLKHLVELKRERAEVERQLHKRQEEDFRLILSRFLAQSEEERFPLAAWMRLEPLLAARRYAFVGNVRELLQHAEECYSTVCAERKAERYRLEQEQEQARRQQEAERLRREQTRKQRAEQAAHRLQVIMILTAWSLLGALALGVPGAITGAVGWERVGTALLVLVAIGWPFSGVKKNDPDNAVLVTTLFLGSCFLVIFFFFVLSCGGNLSYLKTSSGSAEAAANFGIVGGIIGGIVGVVVGSVILVKRDN